MTESASSLRDGVDVVIVGGVDLTIVTEGRQYLVEFLLAHLLLDEVPDVALVDELVLLGDLLHHVEDELLVVACVLVEALGGRCTVIGGFHVVGAACACIGLLAHEGAVREHALLADAVGHKHLQ